MHTCMHTYLNTYLHTCILVYCKLYSVLLKATVPGGHGKVDLFKVEGKLLVLGCTSSCQTGAKYLNTGKQRQVAKRPINL